MASLEAPVRPAFARIFVCLLACSLLGGCATPRAPFTAYKPLDPPRGIVLVANGAGGGIGASEAIASVVEQTRQPLVVRSIDWSHGQGRIFADVTDVEHGQCEGKQLANLIASYRDKCPNIPICLVGHSAGAHVVLEAAKSLKPDSVDRIVLFAPAVAADYDLRSALAAAKQGVEVFYSERDNIFLGIGTVILGTADGESGVPPAGRVGFDPPVLSPCESKLIGRLHQHPWDRSVVWTRNNGSHDGTLRPAFLRAYVLPLMN